MKFISIRDLRNTPGQVWEAIAGEDAILTANGKPVGVLIRAGDEDLDSFLALIRQVRAQLAVSRMRSAARRKGSAALTQREINEEIDAVRAERT